MNKRQPYSLPDDQCERLTRKEFNALTTLMAHLSSTAFAEEDLARRLECIPRGKQRLKMAIGGLRWVCEDLIGTVSKTQCKQIYGVMKDYDVRIVPKLTPGSQNIILQKDIGVDLIDAARLKCAGCVEDGESCRRCKLYKVLEATTPLDDYGSGVICPYSRIDWEE